MHACNTGFTILSLLTLIVGGFGCSGGGTGSDGDISVGAAALYPGAGVSLTDPEACIVTTSTRLLGFGGDADSSSSYRWLSYVAERRIVRDVAIDAEGTPFGLKSIANSSTYRRLDEDGRTLVWATEEGDGELQRSDLARDTRGNVVSYRQVQTTRRDLAAVPPEQPSLAYYFVNHYSSSGLLEKHNLADSSASTRYTHDSEGRCKLIIGSQRVEHRDYDESGRLSAQIMGPRLPDAPLDPVDSVQSFIITHHYDAQGRPLATEQDGGGPDALPIDGQPDMQTLWSYADDGSWQIEYIDFTSEAPNDLVDRNGALQSALHRTEAWSPGCAAVQDSIPVASASACVAD